jgi:hypothetical protein
MSREQDDIETKKSCEGSTPPGGWDSQERGDYVCLYPLKPQMCITCDHARPLAYVEPGDVWCFFLRPMFPDRNQSCDKWRSRPCGTKLRS